MVILGVTHPISHNNAACLIVDGKLIAFAEEERFMRQKHAPHQYAERAIDFCLQQAGLAFDQIDITAISFSGPEKDSLRAEDISSYIECRLPADRQFEFMTGLGLLYHDTRLRSFGRKLEFDHHLCHAASAMVPSSFRSANIISLDGWGGASSGLLGWCRDRGDIEIYRRIPRTMSWGIVYELVTHYLGFQAHSGEGKTMGLASYGEPDSVLLPDYCDSDLGLPDVERYRSYLAKMFPIRKKTEALTPVHKNLAATVQYYYERSLKKIALKLRAASGLSYFTIAGGVGLNCSGNGALAGEPFVEDIFVQPASHDSGTALGAACLAYRTLNGSWPDLGQFHAYWGSGFSNDEIRSALEFANLQYVEVDPAEEAARALADDLLVGFFQGRAEIGPRALGARSILANPAYRENHEKVNRWVKRRELWRPFAPSILGEDYKAVCDARIDSPFMLFAFSVRNPWTTRVPAVVHVDGSCRPQSVNHSTNPVYHRMIGNFKRLTDLPLVLNTSFNLEDEPIVNSPDHAIATFYRSGLDTLVMGNFAVYKRSRS